MRVLIAEDNLLEQRMLQTAVERLGHDCRSAADGAEAWRLYQAWGADLIISDWLMPGLDGQALCQRLREQPDRAAPGGGPRPYTYFLFLTALDDKQHLIAGLQAGADDYLTKPFDLEDLAARFIVAQRIQTLEEERLRLLATEHASRVQAEQAVQVRDEVLTAVSHDLRTQLTAIKVTAQHLEQCARHDAPDRDRLVQGLRRIETSTTLMDDWIEELLDAARLELGQQLTLRQAPTELVALAQQAADDQQRGTEHHRLRVQSALPTLVGRWDAARLRRVLDNLLANAVKYSPVGGEVTVSLETTEHAGQTWAVVQVRDQGVGIPAEDQAHVFERFRRGGNVGRTAGTGIGLAGAREIVAQHGGSLDLQSQVGVGSTFTIRLPLEPSVQNEAATGSGALLG